MTRILIVDDKDENLYYLETLLTGHGCSVDAARHGAEALVKARQHRPDLVVSDLLMPVMDGYTLLRHWKADPQLRDVPFLVYTATYTEAEDERLALDLGADAFLLKPADPEAFLARIREAQRGVAATPAARPEPPDGDETPLLERYSRTLIRKLEEKTLQLEEANAALLRDVTERQRALDRLRESEERFRELAETIQEVFWITDSAKERMLYVSPAYEKIWGRTCASLHESPSSWLEAIHPEDRARVAQASGIGQVSGDYDETYRIVRPDGTLRWIRDRAFPVRGERGEILRVVGTAEDVTEQRQLEQQFRQSQKMEAIGQLAAGVAHDFNNLLPAILGNAELALADGVDGNRTRDYLEEIRKAGRRAQGLVEQILAFSRQQPRERRVIALGPIVEEAVRFLRASIPSTVELSVSLDAAAPPVLADPTQIHQVIANLCTNAWHALGDQPGSIEVELKTLELGAGFASELRGIRPGPVACLSVRDDGVGMDGAAIERIFDPFFTTKEPGKGTGLGLSVVHGIVQEHDGAIAVSSQPGQGSTFRLYLPAAAAVAAAEAALPALAPNRGHGQHILFVDDEESLVLLARRMLERLGYRFTGFTRAADALRAFRNDPDRFDLAITDFNMPGASGLQVTADLLRVRPDLPVALCSGHVTEELRQRAYRAGAIHVIHKPNTMGEMAEAIRHLVHEADGAPPS